MAVSSWARLTWSLAPWPVVGRSDSVRSGQVRGLGRVLSRAELVPVAGGRAAPGPLATSLRGAGPPSPATLVAGARPRQPRAHHRDTQAASQEHAGDQRGHGPDRRAGAASRPSRCGRAAAATAAPAPPRGSSMTREHGDGRPVRRQRHGRPRRRPGDHAARRRAGDGSGGATSARPTSPGRPGSAPVADTWPTPRTASRVRPVDPGAQAAGDES